MLAPVVIATKDSRGRVDPHLAMILARAEGLQDEADQMKRNNAGPEDWARFFVEVRNLYEDLDAIRQAVGEVKTALAYERVPDIFQRDGVSSLTLKVGKDRYRITISGLVRASIKDRETAFAWLREHGHGDLIIATVNASTLTAFAKELLEKGEELPDDRFNVHTGFNTSVTKVK